MDEPGTITSCFERHAGPLLLYARQWLERSEAEDVVQEAFVQLLRQPRMPQNARAWLFAVVRKSAISATRSRQRRQQRHAVHGSSDAAWFDSPAEAVADAEAIQQALAGLDQQQREVVVLRIWGGLGWAEVARLCNSPLSTVHDRYRRALEQMRLTLELPCEKK